MDCTAVLILGRRATGKTAFAKQLISRYMGNTPVLVYTSSPFEWTDQSFQVTSVLSEFKERIDEQRNLAMRLKKRINEQRDLAMRFRVRLPIGLVAVIDEGILRNNDRDFLMNARHYGAAVILVRKSLSSLPPWCRGQFDSTIIFKPSPNANERKLMYNAFAESLPITFENFQKVVSDCTSGVGDALWIDNANGKMSKLKICFEDVKQHISISHGWTRVGGELKLADKDGIDRIGQTATVEQPPVRAEQPSATARSSITIGRMASATADSVAIEQTSTHGSESMIGVSSTTSAASHNDDEGVRARSGGIADMCRVFSDLQVKHDGKAKGDKEGA